MIIPESLQDAMSREAQAAREKEARIILGQAEVEIAHLFAQASESYEHNPTALHLRAMNILYEGLKEKGSLMLVPSTAVESMGLGGLLGLAAACASRPSATISPRMGRRVSRCQSRRTGRGSVPRSGAPGSSVRAKRPRLDTCRGRKRGSCSRTTGMTTSGNRSTLMRLKRNRRRPDQERCVLKGINRRCPHSARVMFRSAAPAMAQYTGVQKTKIGRTITAGAS